MTAHVNTVAFQGVDVVHVDVQVQMGAGLPAFTIVGLPDKAVGESRERVRAALQALGVPPSRIDFPKVKIFRFGHVAKNFRRIDAPATGAQVCQPYFSQCLNHQGVVP